ncbi:MAG: DUF6448 family protein, partial [Anaerolineae bacterium]|nr:DUF6448 family protein [Anaerolineae bacterium]
MVFTSKGLLRNALFGGVILLLITLAFAPATVQAHCDSEQGPVATAARQALEQGDVNLILPYVAPDYEAQLAEAFEQALE